MPVTHPLFCHARQELLTPCPDFVLDASFRTALTVQPAAAQFRLHSSANKLDVSIDLGFGFTGDLFVAETGAFVPQTGARQFTGYRVVRVDRERSRIRPFVVNLGNTTEEIFGPGGFNKPVDVTFQEKVLFVVDFGIFEPGLQLQEPGTGKVWMGARRWVPAACRHRWVREGQSGWRIPHLGPLPPVIPAFWRRAGATHPAHALERALPTFFLRHLAHSCLE